MRIALAQINTTVGDFDGNVALVRDAVGRAVDLGAELIVFPEQTLPGYPAEDLLERVDFVEDCESALGEVVEISRGVQAGIIVGALTRTDSGVGKPVYNSATFVCDGKILGRQHKTLLPTYDVFDEARYFQPADDHRIFELGRRRIGVAVCEDVWNDPTFWEHRLYRTDPVERLVELGADLLVVISASPFSLGRVDFRKRMVRTLVKRWSLPVVFVNLVGGNTSLIFDGNSFAVGSTGDLLAACRSFEEDLVVCDIDGRDRLVEQSIDTTEDAYGALVLGTRDYVRKTGFERAVIGLSGGIDSSVTAVIAADALGAANVLGVSMPTRYSSEGSKTDAAALAERLGIEYHVLPVEPIFATALEVLAPVFGDAPPDVTEENIQARARGLVLMALSNKLGALLLTTGNKSELAVGYCTLYGDMCGGLAVISDVPKTLVFRLARYINRSEEIIPRTVLEKPPSAELRPDQKDEDALPKYEVLDRILEGFVEKNLSTEAIAADGIRQELVEDVIRMVQRNEYKRKQAAPGLRITSKAFGTGRRFPIVQRYRY